MSSFQFPEPPTGLDFGEFLKVCWDLGIRPPGKDCGRPWQQTEFARCIGLSDKQMSNYLKKRRPSLPRYPPTAVEKALFGDDQQYLLDWRRELRAALKRTQERNATSNSEVKLVLYENGPAIVGGIGIAQGLVHLVWILSLFLKEETGELLQSPWTYADFVFGFGGILLGLGCLGVRRWGRIGGICFCLLALLCSYLWFMDERNSDVSRVVFAVNLLTPPFALGALGYFLFGWPQPNKRLFSSARATVAAGEIEAKD